MPRFQKKLVCAAIAAVFITVLAGRFFYGWFGPTADPVYVRRLLKAEHCRSGFPAERQTLKLAKRSLEVGVRNAMGNEVREVSGLEKGTPVIVFAALSHLGGYGEVMWVDKWKNFPVSLKSVRAGATINEVPRNEAVEAALKAIDDAGGVLIWAGPGRHLVVKKEEREKFEAALWELGWLRGKPTPWD